MKKFLIYAISMFFVMTALTGCHDEEPVIPDDDNNVTPIEYPTEDLITGHYSGNYAIIGSDDYDEVTQYVLKRFTGDRSSYSPTGDFIADDVQFVFLNNDALLSLEKPMVMQLKKVVENGGYIYVHKPNPLALVFLSMAIYGDIEKAMEDMRNGTLQNQTRADDDDATASYDTYIMGPANCQLCMLDIYDGSTMTIDVYDPETGEMNSEVVQPGVPSAYEYGQFAEGVIDWLNENATATRGGTATRATDNSVLDNAANVRIIVPCKTYLSPKNGYANYSATVQAWISDAYNFDTDEDYYHVVLEEEFDGSKCYRGQVYKKKVSVWGYNWKEAGCVYSGVTVDPSFYGSGVLRAAWNPQPENKGVTSNVETISGWSFSHQIGYSGGIAALFSGEFKSEKKVTTLDPAITPILKNHESIGFYWEYELKNDLYYSRKKMDAGGLFNGYLNEPAKNSLTINPCKTRQSWNWLFGRTKEMGNGQLTMSLHLKFYTLKAYHHDKLWTTRHLANEGNDCVDIKLPIPNRCKMTYSMSCENAVLSEWSALKDEIISHDRENFSKLNATRCAPTDELVEQRTAALWNETIKGVASRISTFNHLEKDKYVVVLKNNNGKVVGKKLIVTPSGARVED